MHMISRQLYRNSMYCRARFTKSLCQLQPSSGVKKLLSGFAKDEQWKISYENAWTVVFVLFCFCGSPYCICICRSVPFRLKMYSMWVFKLITQRDLLRFVVLNLLVFVPLLNILCLTWLWLLLPGRGTAENREGREFFPLVLIYLECQRKTLSEHIDLTVICAVLGRSH